MSIKVLIIDDEKNIRDLIRRYLKLEDIESDGAENGLSAQRNLKESHYDACIIDLKMPGMDGLTLIKWIRSQGYRMPIIMISAHGEISDAVTAMKEGAQDYILKPFDPEELTIRLKKLIEMQQMRNRIELQERSEATSQESLIGESPPMKQIKQIIGKISNAAATVLITGESGTGKEVVARQIHGSSKLSEGPFVAVNIGGVPENLLESELFGYEKGAFTGAAGRKAGMFELASGGTLFLDEIGDMPLVLQVKLLRVLQERRITRLGGTTTIPINARIIAATNKDLEDRVRRGDFREDLFYRLNVVRVEIPPLRDRRDDIPLLAGGIINRLNRNMGTSIEGISEKGIALLKEYSFPGNVRELENVLERAVIFSETSLLGPDDFELKGVVFHPQEDASSDQSAANAAAVTARRGSDDGSAAMDDGEGKSLRDIERETIIRALHRWEGNRTRAAEELGISRRTLINKIADYNL